LLRLLLPLDCKIWCNLNRILENQYPFLLTAHRTIQSVEATGGVYKGQGRNHRGLLIHDY